MNELWWWWRTVDEKRKWPLKLHVCPDNSSLCSGLYTHIVQEMLWDSGTNRLVQSNRQDIKTWQRCIFSQEDRSILQPLQEPSSAAEEPRKNSLSLLQSWCWDSSSNMWWKWQSNEFKGNLCWDWSGSEISCVVFQLFSSDCIYIGN